jgi:hypothetical protein
LTATTKISAAFLSKKGNSNFVTLSKNVGLFVPGADFAARGEIFSDLGQLAPHIASARKMFPSGCKIGSRYEKSDFFRQRH